MKQISNWHQTKLGLLVFGVVELGLAYIFASLAINSAHTWQWLLAVIFGLGVLQNAGRLAGKIIHGKR